MHEKSIDTEKVLTTACNSALCMVSLFMDVEDTPENMFTFTEGYKGLVEIVNETCGDEATVKMLKIIDEKLTAIRRKAEEKCGSN